MPSVNVRVLIPLLAMLAAATASGETRFIRIWPASVTIPEEIVRLVVIARSGTLAGRNVALAVPLKMPFVAVPRLQRV